jgi:hypothetical protein
MKYLLLLAFLLTGLTSCKKEAPEVTAPFLGHWQSEAYTYQVIDATGKVTPGTQSPQVAQLIITTTTIEFSGTIGDVDYVNKVPYTRTGELLTLDNPSSPNTKSYVRSLTADSFTLEQSLLSSTGNTVVKYGYFHR